MTPFTHNQEDIRQRTSGVQGGPQDDKGSGNSNIHSDSSAGAAVTDDNTEDTNPNSEPHQDDSFHYIPGESEELDSNTDTGALTDREQEKDGSTSI